MHVLTRTYAHVILIASNDTDLRVGLSLPMQDTEETTTMTYTKAQIAEIAMMKAAKARYESGKLTATDRKQIAEFRRHFQPQG
jgi:hypothetical protein